MTRVIGSAGRDGDGIAIRLTAGPRRGCYRVAAEEVPRPPRRRRSRDALVR